MLFCDNSKVYSNVYILKFQIGVNSKAANEDVNTQKIAILVLDKVIDSKMQFSLKNGQNWWFSGHFSLNKIVFLKNH